VVVAGQTQLEEGLNFNRPPKFNDDARTRACGLAQPSVANLVCFLEKHRHC
jgi:hypothetical protein